MDNFLKIFARVKEATTIKNMVQLSEVVEASQQNVSWRKKEDNFPVEWAYKIAKQYGLNIEWILEGTGPQRPGQGNDDLEVLKPVKKWLLETEKKEPGTITWFQIEFKRNFPEFERWQKREQNYIAERDTAVESSIA